MRRLKKPDEYFSARTSRLARKVGDAVLLAGTTLSAVSLETMPHWVTYLSIGLTFFGKVISNFFTDEITVYSSRRTDIA